MANEKAIETRALKAAFQKYDNSLARVSFSNDYEDLSNKPNIPIVPTDVSAFSNDANYQTASDVSTTVNNAISNVLSSVYKPKGSVATYNDLPADADPGDVYDTLDTGMNYAWTGSEWDALSSIVDLSQYSTIDHKHDASDITSGVLGSSRGGTGSSSFLSITTDSSDRGNAPNGSWYKLCRKTFNIPGTYLILGWCSFASNATGRRALAMVRNGTPTGLSDGRSTVQNAVSGGATAMQVMYFLGGQAVNDYVDFGCFQNSGSALAVSYNLRTIYLGK